MSLLLDRWNKEIKPKINGTNKNNVGPQPATSTSSSAKAPFSTQAYNPTKTTNKNTNNGYSYAGEYSSSGGSSKNSQYTGSSNGVKVNNSQQQSYKDEMNANSLAWHSADETEKKRLEERNKYLASLLGGTVAFDSVTGTWSGTANTTQENILDWEYEEEKPDDYQSKYDSQINAILNEILNREDFSYDVMNDPLYQQYAAMYQREGDRAMKETLAEAAASAGGMNTYAITAAQQANSYYNSQLNDRIPELYQLAYEMYLNDKESKVQDLGILQNMDATQYNRYRDTINDWYNDKNFAYGVYQDAVQQGNWQTTFNNNNYWANKEFQNNEYWKNKEFDYNDMWTNKEWDANQEEKAYAQILDWIDMGVTTFSDEELAKAGIDRTKVNQMIADHQAQQAKTGTSSGSSRSSNSSGYTGSNKKKEDDTGYIPKKEETEPTDTTWIKAIYDLGLPAMLSPSVLVELENAGAIQEVAEYDEDTGWYTSTKVAWKPGWNAQNYKLKLKEAQSSSTILRRLL